jgi:hypothetical protein
MLKRSALISVSGVGSLFEGCAEGAYNRLGCAEGAYNRLGCAELQLSYKYRMTSIYI